MGSTIGVTDSEGNLVRPPLPEPLGIGDNAGRVLAVCVVTQIRQDPGNVGVTAIDKRSVSGPCKVGRLGLYGDLQANRAKHGGVNRAVYAISEREVQAWSEILDKEIPYGQFGENLRVDGPLDDLEIGARVRIGDVELEAKGPRNPCATLARWTQRPTMIKDFTFRGRGGVCFAVTKIGKVEAGQDLEVSYTPGHGVSVARWFTHQYPADARTLLAAQDAGAIEIADNVMKYVRAAATRG
ncbi:MOSC domain-containing protein [Actinomycetaceae bacterium L2_0104]